MSFRSPPALMTLVIAVLALVSAPRPAYACQLSRPVSPLEHLYGASAVVYGEVVTATAQGYLVRFKDTLAGATNLTETVLPFSDCDTLTVGTRLALALRSPMPSRFVLYPVMQWPSEAENQELIRAFSGAATDAARAKVLVAHAHKGRASYVDFPAIALFLLHTPGVVKTLSAPEARRLLADLSHHPRARRCHGSTRSALQQRTAAVALRQDQNRGTGCLRPRVFDRDEPEDREAKPMRQFAAAF